jgi:choline kinase
VKAIILGAGQGKRLLPLTEDRPKALLPVAGRRLVEWQIEALAEVGIEEVVFVSGFNTPLVEEMLSGYRPDHGSIRVRVIHNPFFAVSDNISSCWVARGEMTQDFLLLNGDTLLRAPLLRRLLSGSQAPVTLAVDQKAVYDEDDMKVRLEGTRLLDIGKKLPSDSVDAESIGCMVFRREGPELFVRYLEDVLREPENLKLWYLSVIRQMAADGVEVDTTLISGHPWCEIDYPLDLKRAQTMLKDWATTGADGTGQAALGTS